MSDSAIQFDLLGPGDYDRAKKILNRARHPGFVGRELFYRCATTGICCVAVVNGDDLGVALVAKQKLQALSVVREAQGGGIGKALITRTAPQWVNAIMERVPWFEKRGYVCVGAPRVGQSGKMATQLMQLGAAGIVGHEGGASPSGASIGPSLRAPILEEPPLVMRCRRCGGPRPCPCLTPSRAPGVSRPLRFVRLAKPSSAT